MEGENISHRTSWANYSWGDSLLEFWDDFLDDGKLDNRFANTDSLFDENSSPLTPKPGELPSPVASIADIRKVPAGGSTTFRFIISWNFSNRHAWMSTDYGDISQALYSEDVVGNAYSGKAKDAWDATLQVVDKLPELEERSLNFISSIMKSELPEPIKESALFNLREVRPFSKQPMDIIMAGKELVIEKAAVTEVVRMFGITNKRVLTCLAR
jgi:hypothetical protein